jgi:hypothetical protein
VLQMLQRLENPIFLQPCSRLLLAFPCTKSHVQEHASLRPLLHFTQPCFCNSVFDGANTLLEV